MRKLLPCLYFLSLFATVTSYSQKEFFVVNYNTDDGLPQNTVKDFRFDNAGFLWIVTENSLVRFDGTVFKSSSSMEVNTISRIATMNSNADKRIFVTDINGKVAEIGNGNLMPVRKKDHQAKFTANITLGTRLPFDLFQKLNNLNFISRKDDNTLFDLIPMDGNQYFLVYKDKIALFDDTTRLFECSNPSRSAYRLFKIGNQLFAYNAKSGFYTFDFSYKKWIKRKDEFGFHYKLPLQIIWENNLSYPFIISNGKLFKIDSSDGRFKSTLLIDSLLLPSEVRCVEYNSNWDMYVLGTETDGLYIYKKKLFQTMRSASRNKPYYGQYELPTGGVVTNSGDVIGSNPAQRSTSFIRSFNNYIITGTDGNIYYSSGDTVYEYQKASRKSEMIFIDPRSEMFALDYQADTLWMINAKGIFFHTRNRNYPSLLFPPDSRNLPYAIQRIEPGKFLYGNCLGLFSYTPTTRKVDTLLWIPQRCVRALWKFNNKIFIGTYGDGWKIWNGKNLVNMPLDRNEYLKEAHCFIKDSNNYLWIPTNHGLFKYFLPDVEKYAEGKTTSIYYHYYGKSNGIENDEFNGGCYPCALQLRNGYVSIPNLAGLVWFKPEQVKHEIPSSPIIVDKFDADGKTIDILQKQIRLSHTRIIRIEVSSPLFDNQENAPIQYRTEGVDTTWKFLDRNNMSIRYTILPAGHYRLQLRRPQGFAKPYLSRTIEFTILQPWYLSTIALAFWILLFNLLLILLIRLRVRHYRKRELELNQLVEQKVSELKTAHHSLEQNIGILETYQQELLKSNATQSRLIRVMSHDITGPLRFMMMVSRQVEKQKEQIDKKDLLESMSEIYTTSENLLTLCNELISWTRHQKENMQVSNETFDLNKLIEEKMAFFQQIANRRSIRLQKTCPAHFFIYNDKNIVKIILHNLLSNAIKFTHGGTVEILAGSDGNLYYLTVIDTGEGMSEEQVYALLHNNIDISNFGMDGKQGAGIGFLIVNDLVRATQGEISIDSIKGKGSRVTIKWAQTE